MTYVAVPLVTQIKGPLHMHTHSTYVTNKQRKLPRQLIRSIFEISHEIRKGQARVNISILKYISILKR